ncbi:MAG: hypothetical protein ACPHOG_08425, partial [Verrucomicrobiales bacterium]
EPTPEPTAEPTPEPTPEPSDIKDKSGDSSFGLGGFEILFLLIVFALIVWVKIKKNKTDQDY